MRAYTYPQFPNYKVNISLFGDISNGEELRSKAAELPFALIDAKLVCSVEQLCSAIYRALIDVTYNKMRTKSLQSECLFCLSPTSNIGEAFKTFGIKDESTEIICVRLESLEMVPSDESVFDCVHGKEIDLADENLAKIYDKNSIRKAYKLDQDFQPETIEEFSRALVNAIQLRGL